MSLCIVTATTDLPRARPRIESWGSTPVVIVENGSAAKYLGSVAAFRRGVDLALEKSDADIIACFHDDLIIHDRSWATTVARYFQHYPAIGLVGFGGAIGLGSSDLYQAPYDPMQLARIGFRSNLVDAETHGTRSLLPERVACLDGFSQIGRRAFWEGVAYDTSRRDGDRVPFEQRPWTVLQELGFIHHFYDGALGCLAARYGWETWYLPVRCTHLGGQTAVGDPGYQAWAQTQHRDGDRGFWADAHRIGYEAFRDVLPLRV